MRPPILPLAALTVLSVALAGCQGSDLDAQADVPTKDSEGRYVIHVGSDGQLAFDPARAVVPVGATVVWVQERGFHNVMAENGSFTSGDASDDGWTYEHTFLETGEYGYHCTPHKGAGMRGVIQVEA